jgi:hypothetical protein
MGLAFEMARASLRFPDRGNAPDKIIAQKIIALAKAGERNPDRLCDSALNDFWR